MEPEQTEDLQEPEDEHEEAARVRGFERFTPAALPDGIGIDPVRGRCMSTALYVSLTFGLTPARGYGLFKRDPIYGDPVWIGHWWAVTEDGIVVDSAWVEPGLAYIGERLLSKTEPDEDGRDLMLAESPDGERITGLGVYRYPPVVVVAELEAIAQR